MKLFEYASDSTFQCVLSRGSRVGDGQEEEYLKQESTDKPQKMVRTSDNEKVEL